MRFVEKVLVKVRAEGHTATDVVRILNEFGDRSSNDAFFHGSGGDDSLRDALPDTWTTRWWGAGYHWIAQAEDGSGIEYIEGDVALLKDGASVIHHVNWLVKNR